MNRIILWIGEGRKFDLERMSLLLSSIEGTYDLKEVTPDMFGTWIEAEYEHAGNHSNIRLNENLENVSLLYAGEAAIDLAFRIQKAHAEPLRAFDMYYTFDLIVSDYESVADFSEAIDKGRFDGTRNDPPENRRV